MKAAKSTKKQEPEKRKPGRPFQGFTEPVMTRVSPELKDWLAGLVRQSGLREGDLVRRFLEDAKAAKWSPGAP